MFSTNLVTQGGIVVVDVSGDRSPVRDVSLARQLLKLHHVIGPEL